MKKIIKVVLSFGLTLAVANCIAEPLSPSSSVLPETLSFSASSPSYDANYGIAFIVSDNGNCVNLRSRPSVESHSMGLYYPGVEVICHSPLSSEWVFVTIGGRTGYIKHEYLQSNPDSSISFPLRTIKNTFNSNWLNLRTHPWLDNESKVIGQYSPGDIVTLMGIIDPDWVYVKTSDGKTGFMMSQYLQEPSNGLTPETPPDHQIYRTCLHTNQHTNEGYTIDADLIRDTNGNLSINISLMLDADYTTNDDLIGFNLYVNHEKILTASPYWPAESKILAATNFCGASHYFRNIDSAYLKPVYEEGGEYSHIIIPFNENTFPEMTQNPIYTPEPSYPTSSETTHFYANQHLKEGYTLSADLAKTTNHNTITLIVSLTLDPDYTTNDDLVGFNLYINGTNVLTAHPYWTADNKILTATNFCGAAQFSGNIQSLYLVPVYEEGGEYAHIIIPFNEEAL